jgi:hypothetical protein
MHCSSSLELFTPPSAGRKYRYIPSEFVFFVYENGLSVFIVMLLVPIGMRF